MTVGVVVEAVIEMTKTVTRVNVMIGNIEKTLRAIGKE